VSNALGSGAYFFGIRPSAFDTDAPVIIQNNLYRGCPVKRQLRSVQDSGETIFAILTILFAK
jgi:hypothetical protein